jgi:hypothetical protein
MYEISDYTKQKAKEIGVIVKPSKSKNKKIDVFKQNVKIATIGDTRYKDYPTYIKEQGIFYANQRRKLYKIRHEKDRAVIGSAGYFADKLLW